MPSEAKALAALLFLIFGAWVSALIILWAIEELWWVVLAV